MSHISDKLKKSYSKKLLKYQITHTENIIRIIRTNNSVLDASDTGTGKTYTAIASCAQLGFEPIIICPKTVMANWRIVCEYFEISKYLIVNYETIRLCKYYVGDKRIKYKYLKYYPQTNNTIEKFVWNHTEMSPNTVFIFDEAHKCSDIGTLNAKLLLSAKMTTNFPLILLSATISDNTEKFKLFFYILNFIDKQTVEANNIDFVSYMRIVEQWMSREAKPMVRIHRMLYPARASRMSIDVLGDLFPQTQIVAQPYTMGRKEERLIEKEYQTISQCLEELSDKRKADKGNPLVRILRARQKIELLKIPTFVELAKDYISEGFSVVVFVNFTNTLQSIAKMLSTDCLIYGEQSDSEREKNINNFQSNKSNIIICNIRAGGVGISLHDIHGKHPRVSLISPTFSSIDLTQALGRIHRANGMSKSLQRIIYCAGTVEEKIADKVRIKLRDMGNLNNGDLDLSNIVYQNNPMSAAV